VERYWRILRSLLGGKFMVPEPGHRAWRELILGTKQIPSTHFGFNLLLTTNRICYQRDQSEDGIAVLAQHLYDYLAKYEGLYQDELKQIFGDDYTALFS
jgi:hypothetical protein